MELQCCLALLQDLLYFSTELEKNLFLGIRSQLSAVLLVFCTPQPTQVM